MRRGQRGFTLLELLLVMGLLSLIVAPIYETVITGLRVAGRAAQREDLRQQLSTALQRLSRDIAVAGNVDVAQDGRFQFDTPGVNNVDYVYTSGTQRLSRDDAATAQLDILRNLASFDFNYYDNTGALLTTPVAGSAEDTIRVVQIIATMTSGSETITVASAAYLRNI